MPDQVICNFEIPGVSFYWVLGGSRLIHFLQLRRFLRSLDGSTNTGVPSVSHTPRAVTLLHDKASKNGTSWDLIDALNSYGQILSDKDIAITICLSITSLQNKQNVSHFVTIDSWNSRRADIIVKATKFI